MTFYAGIDLGGTKIAAGILNADTGKLIAQDVIPTQAEQGADAVMARMAVFVQRLAEKTGVTLSGVGIGVPAVVDYEGGRTLLMPNLTGDWYGKPVVAELEAALAVPVAIINDARAFTLAEATLGAGRGASTCVCFTIGTGIGGGIALDGRLHFGLKGAAGEFGHQTVDPNGAVCGCGNSGCLEALASGYAITRYGVEAAQQYPNGLLNTLVESDFTRITPEIILHAAERGDQSAGEILQRAGTYLGIGIANVLTLLSADCVVIGGGVSALGDWLLNPVRETLRLRCHTVALDEVKIVRAALGQNAGVIGAALWASEQLKAKSNLYTSS